MHFVPLYVSWVQDRPEHPTEFMNSILTMVQTCICQVCALRRLHDEADTTVSHTAGAEDETGA